jgi:hypothetical protein
MAAGLNGCGDCGPQNPNRHPAAPEACTGLDDDCDGDPNDDGADDCGGGACCPGYGCADTQVDPYHCGACGNACSSHEAKDCVNGTCGCGTGPACLPGQVCDGGSCGCEVDWTELCGGCCWHNGCLRIWEQDDQRCGTGGGLCENCAAQGQSCDNNSCN